MKILAFGEAHATHQLDGGTGFTSVRPTVAVQLRRKVTRVSLQIKRVKAPLLLIVHSHGERVCFGISKADLKTQNQL